MIQVRLERRLDTTTETALREKNALTVNITRKVIEKDVQLDIIRRKTVHRVSPAADQATEEEEVIEVVSITDRDLQEWVSADSSMRARVLADSTIGKSHSRMSSLTLMVILDMAFISYIIPKEEVPNAVLLVKVFALILMLLTKEEAWVAANAVDLEVALPAAS